MDVLIYLKNVFVKNATSLPCINAKTRFWLSVLLFLNILYVYANGHHMFTHLDWISNRTLNTIAFGVSAGGFLYILRPWLVNTLNFSRGRLKRSVVYASLTYFSCYILYWLYNSLTKWLFPPLGGDVQKIRQIAKIDWWTYGGIVVKYIFTLMNEELIIFSVFLIALSFMQPKVLNTLVAIFTALLVFGLMHVSSWNWATVPAVMFNKLPACLLLVFFKDLKLLYLAHLFNNCFVSLVLVEGMTGNFRNWVFFAFLVPLLVFMGWHTVRDCQNNNRQ